MLKKFAIFSLLTICSFFGVVQAQGTETATAAVQDLSEADFEKTVANGASIIDFYAVWCGPCKKYAPAFERTAAKRKDVRFFKVNVDYAHNISNKYGVKSIPHTIMFVDGKVVNSYTGEMSDNKLNEFIDSGLQKGKK